MPEDKPKVKVFDIAERKIDSDGDGDTAKVYLSGYANTKNEVDSYGDYPTNYDGKPVYDLGRMETNPVCLVDHRISASNIAGNFTELVETDKGLWFRLLLRPLAQVYNDMVKDAISSYIHGFGRALSIAGQWLYEDADHPTHLTTAKIGEISLVGVGAAPNALTTTDYPKALQDYAHSLAGGAHKNMCAKTVTPWSRLPKQFAPQDRRWDARAATNRWRPASGSTDVPNTRYKDNFLWYDAANKDNYGAYKLPIGDIVDGKHLAVPRAIFAARAAIDGARGGVDIPDSDVAGVKRNISRYYVAMGLDDPYKSTGQSTWSAQEILSLPRGDLAYVLRYGALSRNAADYVAGAICAAQVMDDNSDICNDSAIISQSYDGYDTINQSLDRLTAQLSVQLNNQ
jgi:hypothetical protein